MARTSHARDAKRERILEGAIEAFAAKGFHGTRVSDVARAAGVADGTIYLYFANKNELLESVFESAMDAFHRSSADYVLEDDDPAAQMRRLVEMHLKNLGENRKLASVFQVDLRHSQHFLGEISRRVLLPHLEFIAAIVERGQAKALFHAEWDTREAAIMIFGVLDQLASAWILSHRNYRLESQAPQASTFILRGLAA
jgi:TetR/AcrR family fatty acid metabolism transcriptional regulator